MLSACGQSAPPGQELANEIVDTLLADGEITEQAATCMRSRIDEFSLSEEDAQGFNDFDDVFSKADGGNERAQQLVEAFEATLEDCN